MKITPLSVLVFAGLLFCACKKNSSSSPTPVTAKCKPLTESSNLAGNNATYTYSYNTDGTLANISYPPYALAVVYNATSLTYPATNVNQTNSEATAYNANIYTGLLPTEGRLSITLDGITQVDYMVYNFSYDAKSRLIEVIETTPHNANDYEYKLIISYTDNDNVSQLKYETTTGPAGVQTIIATGYDDKPSPYTGIKNWHLFMHGGWSNYDPALIFAALSKNNPLGNDGGLDSRKRSCVYTYNENGYPITRVNTNTSKINGSTYTFEENYTYQCN